jgi:hypothetical protein
VLPLGCHRNGFPIANGGLVARWCHFARPAPPSPLRPGILRTARPPISDFNSYLSLLPVHHGSSSSLFIHSLRVREKAFYRCPQSGKRFRECFHIRSEGTFFFPCALYIATAKSGCDIKITEGPAHSPESAALSGGAVVRCAGTALGWGCCIALPA